MNDHGILLETTNTLDILSNVSGGIDQKTATVGDLDLLLTVDMKKLVPALKGGTLFVYGLGLYGDDPSKHVGDIQAVDNIAAPNTWKLFEAWYQQNLLERFSLLAGLGCFAGLWEYARIVRPPGTRGLTPALVLAGSAAGLGLLLAAHAGRSDLIALVLSLNMAVAGLSITHHDHGADEFVF